MPLTNDSLLQSQIGDQTSSSGLITNTAADQLATLMRNPQRVTGNPQDNPTTDAQATPKGVPNPYGLGLAAYEPNTSVYINEAASGLTGDIKQASAGSVGDATAGSADATLTPEQAGQQGKDAQSAQQAMSFAGGGVVDATGKVQAIINAALHAAALNVPYVWGGTTLNGLDCSGLLYYAAQSAGLTDWKRYRAQDYGHMGTTVTADQARPGDVVFYDEGGGNGHVGLYLGNGMMVAAPQTGENVQVQHVYGKPTSYQRIFTDNMFGNVATPGGGQGYNYGGAAWDSSGVAQAQGQSAANFGFGALGALFGNPSGLLSRGGGITGGAGGALNDSQESGRESGQYTRDSGYGGGTVGGQLVGGVPYAGLFQSASAQYGVPAALLAAVAHQESGFNPMARSGAGAQGLMQFMPGTAAGLGVNPWDPTSSVNGAAKYLQGLYRQFGSWDLALAAYNAGPGNVRKYGGVPPFAETQNYVRNITALAQQYAGA